MSVSKATIENKTTSVTKHFKKLTTTTLFHHEGITNNEMKERTANKRPDTEPKAKSVE